MILNLLIAIWAICGNAGAAPQYGPVESTVTVYAPCSETPAPFPTAVASNRMAQISADRSLPVYVAPTVSTYSSVGFSKSAWTIEASQSKLTGSLETAAEVRQIPQSSSNVFSFIIVKGTTSWLNGQTPTSAPSQSFVVIMSAITVIPLSISPPPVSTSTSSSEVVVISTATVIPLSTAPSLAPSSSYSSAKSSGSESVIISTATVIPLSTLPSSQSSSMITKTKSVSASEPVVMSTVTTTPVSSTSPSSSSVTSQLAYSSNMVITLTTTKTTVVPFSTLLSTATASSKSTFTSTAAIISSTSTFASATLQNAVVSTSAIAFNLSSMSSNLSTTANPLSSLSSVSSLSVSRPEASKSSSKPVASAPSTILPIGVEFSTSLTANSSSKSVSILATHTVFAPISVVFQTSSGRIFTDIASKAGGWNSTSQTVPESAFNTYASVIIGSLATLTGVGGSQAATQTSNSVSATLTTSDSSFPMPTSLSSSVSLSRDTSFFTYTPITSSTSTSGSISTPGFNATSYTSSFSRSTSGSILTPISNVTSTSQSIPSSTTASISSFISVIKGPSSVTFPNSTSSTSTSVISSATPTNCGERGDFVLTFDDIPPLSVSNASDTDVQPEPLFNPYHQFLFSDGFTVVPPPKRLPFLPSSKPLLLEFIPNFEANSSNRKTGPNAADHGFSGQIGSGDEGLTGCFNFNLYGASLGCDSMGPTCDFTFMGYKYDVASQRTSQVTQQVINVPACPKLSSCVLTTVDLDSSFRDLTYFFMNVTVAGKPKLWWMDDLRLGWSDNSCSMGLCRQNAHVR
ncbi:hypothetical protein BCON_0075g00340 [Botryotinia convoluta]|uniref:DUF7371 domain-containing protein n=1 Tax=Botryotinia convoluta TaxID=54673 RepID=A0A4Z1I7H0_9HELO|nr:hypothetical protein BCON_0075g00340 [Botryotinia convoluta]